MEDPATIFDPPFEIKSPGDHTVPMVFNSPHSGRVYPESFLRTSALDPHVLRKSEDYFVDQLFENVVNLGAPLMHANFPRAYLDLNREPYELDPHMFLDRLPDYVNTRSLRAAGGLGTVARIVSEATEIYTAKMSFGEAQARIRSLYIPYHERLRALLRSTREKFDALLMIDCHSMPSAFGSKARNSNANRPDFVLGDRYGTACISPITDLVETVLSRMGYSVVRNKPYAGGYITHTYGRPAIGMHVLQLEVNRSLYVDEDTLEKHGGFYRLCDDLMTVVAELVDCLPELTTPYRAAAAE